MVSIYGSLMNSAVRAPSGQHGISSWIIHRRQATLEDLEGRHLQIGFAQDININGSSLLEIGLKLEVAGEVVGRIARRIYSPFAGRREHVPTDDGNPTALTPSPPSFVLCWSGDNDSSTDVLRRTERTTGYEDSAFITDEQRAERFAIRDGLATINTSIPAWFWSREPALEDSLVIDGREFEPPVRVFRNWKSGAQQLPGWHRNAVFHEERKTQQRNSNINAIVLHETGGYGALDKGYAGSILWRNQPGKKKDVAAHFCVHTDGSIAQHYDTVQKLAHAAHRNSHSIGIECANVCFISPKMAGTPTDYWQHYDQTTKTFAIPNGLSSGETLETTEWWGGNKTTRYVIPKLEQLEACARLIEDLMFLHSVPDTFLPEMSQLTLADGSTLNGRFFLMSRWAPRFGPGSP